MCGLCARVQALKKQIDSLQSFTAFRSKRKKERKKEGDEAETKESLSGIKREIGLSVSHQQQVSHPLSLYVSLTIFSLSLSFC